MTDKFDKRRLERLRDEGRTKRRAQSEIAPQAPYSPGKVARDAAKVIPKQFDALVGIAKQTATEILQMPDETIVVDKNGVEHEIVSPGLISAKASLAASILRAPMASEYPAKSEVDAKFTGGMILQVADSDAANALQNGLDGVKRGS